MGAAGSLFCGGIFKLVGLNPLLGGEEWGPIYQTAMLPSMSTDVSIPFLAGRSGGPLGTTTVTGSYTEKSLNPLLGGEEWGPLATTRMPWWASYVSIPFLAGRSGGQ